MVKTKLFANAYLKRDPEKQKGLRVRSKQIPLSTSDILGTGIDVMHLPEGHMACTICNGYKFECSIIGDFHRLEIGCMACGKAYRMLFPFDCPLPPQNGRFTCFKHPDKGMIIVHNVDVLCVGCESCKTEIVFELKTKSNLILPGDMH